MDLNEVAMREKSHVAGLHAGYAGGTGFTLCDMTYLFEFEEVVRVSKKNTQMMCVWSDAGMRWVNRRYAIARLEFAFALDTLRSPTVVAFLLKVWRCTQIKYNDCCDSILSCAERR